MFQGDRKSITPRLSDDLGLNAYRASELGATVHLLTADAQTHLMIQPYLMQLV